MDPFLVKERRDQQHKQSRIKERDLGSSSEDGEDAYQSFLTKRSGVEYDPYALAWRYLGMYIDCDITFETSEESPEERSRRRLEDSEDDCERKVLWAAYADPRYKGGSIGEYQFFDYATKEWDTSTCKTQRCARLDCHEPKSHFNLIGVFKETDGMVDWAEQLFKHEGICAWNDDDGYEFMQKYREYWPSYCATLSIANPNDGSTLYMHTQPQTEGNMTWGVYSDEECIQESDSVTFSDYVIMHYNYYYYSDGTTAAETWNKTFALWNDYMMTFKLCQPCRAYDLNKVDDGSEDGSEDDHRGRRQAKLRFLGEENDGEGEEEQWGYNCYDDAGYTNCNQCFKFFTHTDMEEASMSDLARASKQGSILTIKVNGRTFGSGGFPSTQPETGTYIFVGVFAAGLAIGGLIWAGRHCLMRKWRTIKSGDPSLRENFQIQSEDAVVT